MSHLFEPEICVVCGGNGLMEHRAYHTLRRVTSDVKPWLAGGRLGVCRACGAVQTFADAGWLADIDAIYAGYEVYHLSEGIEQAVFDRDTGQGARRSQRLVERLAAHIALPDRGAVLDVGCGNGAMLAAFAEQRPDWALYGQEIGDRTLPMLERLPGFAGLFTTPPERIGRRFDVITMIHSLEHFVDPVAALRSVLRLLNDGGVLFVQVPDAAANPFDLLIADHRTHFTAPTLRIVASRAGAEVLSIADDWTPKELSLVLRRQDADAPDDVPERDAAAGERVDAQIAWLDEVRGLAAAEAAAFGIFGTAIGATWLFSYMPEKVAFFIDEDSSRTGRTFMGRPVLSPAETPAGAHVVMPLAPALAERISARLSALPIRFVRPLGRP